MGNPIDLRKIDPDVNYTLEQASEFLNLSYSSILKLKKINSFNDVKQIGRRFYIPGKAILMYVQKGSPK